MLADMAALRALLGLLLRCTLAVALGAGPLGAEVVSTLLHAQLCTCASCGDEREPASCCERSAKLPEGPRIDRERDACPCTVGPRNDGDARPVARACEAPSVLREKVGRAHCCETACVPPVLASDRTSGAQPPAFDTGPPGVHRRSGAARASALRVLRI